jgi:hypothetical protein
MARHVDCRLAQFERRFLVSDRTEETRDNIESKSEIEGAHVALMENNLRMACARNLEHFGCQIEPFDGVVFAEKREMRAGAARDIE